MSELKCGVELHQRLKTSGKLFCDCTPEMRDEKPVAEIVRRQRAVAGELGETDRAALFEFFRNRVFAYQVFPETSCLVELDEEPPHPLNQEALDTSLEIALMLNAKPVDELQVMRKTVTDGSNTSGFQRTCVVAMDGHIDTSMGRVGIPTICLEEESAGIIGRDGKKVVYRLDRLAIPLIEVGTSPDIKSPEHAKEVAQKLGTIFRSTGKVQRGLGTIRQDVNVSVKGGARIEAKGVQELDLLPEYVRVEVQRQESLLKLKKELGKKGFRGMKPEVKDLTSLFSKSKCSILQKAGKVLGTRIGKFKGLLGMELTPGKRFGTELAYIAKEQGLGGIIHSDEELSKYKISDKEIKEVEKRLGVGEGDAFILTGGGTEQVIGIITNRINMALEGVPEETRRALPDGNTAYMRPLPGGARMYPETDIPPIVITKERIERIRKGLSESPEETKKKLAKLLPAELADNLFGSKYLFLFRKLHDQTKAEPKVIASTLLNTLKSLSRDGMDTGKVTEEVLLKLFEAYSKGKVPKEGIEQVLVKVCAEEGIDKILSAYTGTGKEEVRKRIREIVKENTEVVKEKGDKAFSILMGEVMKEFRGKADGGLISKLLREEISNVR